MVHSNKWIFTSNTSTNNLGFYLDSKVNSVRINIFESDFSKHCVVLLWCGHYLFVPDTALSHAVGRWYETPPVKNYIIMLPACHLMWDLLITSTSIKSSHYMLIILVIGWDSTSTRQTILFLINRVHLFQNKMMVCILVFTCNIFVFSPISINWNNSLIAGHEWQETRFVLALVMNFQLSQDFL